VGKAEAATTAEKAKLQAQMAAHTVALLQADRVKLQQLEQQGSKAKKDADGRAGRKGDVHALPHGAA
jgi:hypothetical protein